MSSRSSGRNSGAVTGRQKRTEIARLCDALFGGTPLAISCQTWAAESARFAAFLDTYQDKIGKKLRGVHDEAGFFDVLAELDVAHRLLAERSFALDYEPYLADKQRGPDFGVTFKTHTAFTVEVRHLRPSAVDMSLRLAAILADKVRQLPPSAPNVLALAGAETITATGPVQAAVQMLVAAAAEDDTACRQRGFASARDLLRRMERLSAVVLLEPGIMWEHARARHPLPADLRKALARAFCIGAA